MLYSLLLVVMSIGFFYIISSQPYELFFILILLSFDYQIFQSASLYLSTTTPEQIAFALQWFLRPLDKLGLPVAEVILTLLLSLRFINLVFDEVIKFFPSIFT